MLPKAARLTAEDASSLSEGKSVFGTLLSLRWRSSKELKCSVSVSKRISNRAVDRNRIRRRVYAAIKEPLKFVELPAYILIMPKKETLAAPLERISKEAAELLKKAGLFA